MHILGNNMPQDAKIIVRVAYQMLEKHRADAFRCAEMRAEDLEEDEPRAAARWHLVANTISMFSDGTLKPAA